MEAKEAVQAAKNYVADLFADERLVDLLSLPTSLRHQQPLEFL